METRENDKKISKPIGMEGSKVVSCEDDRRMVLSGMVDERLVMPYST